MSRKTSYEELYTTIGELITLVTGRPYWIKEGLQARPTSTYATVYLAEAGGVSQPVVESEELVPAGDNGESFEQTPWGTVTIDVRVEFFSSRDNDSAQQAATRLKLALYLEERFFDLWEICALAGPPRFIDVSGVFREDIEPRTELRFPILANVASPAPLDGTEIYDINIQEVNVTHVGLDDTETEETITVEDTTEDSSS